MRHALIALQELQMARMEMGRVQEMLETSQENKQLEETAKERVRIALDVHHRHATILFKDFTASV